MFSFKKILEEKDFPIPILTVQRTSVSSINTNWQLDRPIPREACLSIYEVHIRGQNFPDKIKSDQK